MGKLGRFACIFTPMVLTIASLVCLIIVALGGTNKNNSSFNNLYFFQANTSDINIDPSLISLPSSVSNVINETTGVSVDGATSAVKSALNIADFYHISLWNYCSGDYSHNSTGGISADVKYCSPHQNEFWFNPVAVWGLNNSNIEQLFPTALRDGLNTYRVVAKWMFIAYIVALISTIVEILIGFLALFSRLGSVATTIVSSVSTFFVVAFALTSTILYATLVGTFNSALEKYNIHGSLGHGMYVATWLAVAFSLASGLFWMLSSCCCSGRSNRIKYGDGPTRSKFRDAQSPYGYEQVGEPHVGYKTGPGFQVPLQNRGTTGTTSTAYEPFRHEEEQHYGDNHRNGGY